MNRPDNSEPSSVNEFVKNFFRAITLTQEWVSNSPEISQQEAMEISIKATLARFSKEELACLLNLSAGWTKIPGIREAISDCITQRNNGTSESLPEESAKIFRMAERIGKSSLLETEAAQIIAVRSVISGLSDNVVLNLISVSKELWAQSEMFSVLSQRRRGESQGLN